MFLPDTPHLFKNIKSMLMNNKIIRLPDNIVKKFNLSSNEVLSHHIAEILTYQETHTFKLARNCQRKI